jgi:type II secretory pathway component GspD/PulD (secretin)
VSRPNAGTGDCSRQSMALAAPLVALAVLLLASSAALWAQDQAPVRARARTYLQSARESYGRGDYETAAFYYTQAKAHEKELTATEVNDLNNQVLLNNEALRKRREGSDQIRKAQEAFRLGRPAEASALLKSAGLNQYLAASDRQVLMQLSQQLRGPGLTTTKSANTSKPSVTPQPNEGAAPKARALLQEGRALLARGDYLGATAKAGEAEKLNPIYNAGEYTHVQLYMDIERARRTGGKAPVASQKVSGDPNALLTEARAAYQRGDLDGAEELAHQAEKAGGRSSWWRPWADTPAKVLHDVATARAKQNPPASPGSSYKGTKAFFPRTGGTETKQADDKLVPEPQGVNKGASPSATTGNGQTSPAHPSPAYAGGEVAAARPQPTEPRRKEDRSTTAARQLVHEGYDALHKNDLEKARKCAELARNMHVAFNWWEDNPDKLLADIQRKTPGAPVVVQAKEKRPMANQANGHTLVREGRALLRDGKLDQADQFCARAAATQTNWGLFEDSPDKLRSDIQMVRAKQNRDESVKVLADARHLFAQGKLEEAKTKAARAQELHGPYNVWDLGDRPQKLLAEIEHAQGESRLTAKPAPPMMAEKRPPEPVVQVAASQVAKPPSPVPMADTIAKQRALALLREARALQSRGQLIEARQKALEAQRAAADASRPALLFGPDEDRPETALLQLSSLCDAKVNNLIQHASDCAIAGGSDFKHFDRARADLDEARHLAQVFGQDTGRIEHKVAWLQQIQRAATVAQGPQLPPAAPKLPPPPLPPGLAQPGLAKVTNQEPANKGKELLEKARLELRSGQTAMARRLAIEAYDPALGIQEEAVALIRSIDNEDYNQARLTANRNADAGFEAYQRGDYRQAANIFRALKEDYLDPQKRMRLKEISGMPEMQTAVNPTGASAPGSPGSAAPAPIKLSGQDFKAPTEGPGIARVSDTGGHNPSGDSFERLRAMEEIQVQQLREEALRTQQDANERARAGDFVGAMDVLRDFSFRLKDTNIHSPKVDVLARQIESRMQQFRTLKAQRDFEKEQNTGLVNASGSEHARENEKHKRDVEIADLMKQFGALYKEGKYTQAQMKAEQAHELDPDNTAATEALMMVKIGENLARAKEIKQAKEDMFMHALDDHPGPALDMKTPLAFSDDKELENRREKRAGLGRGIRFPYHNPTEQGIDSKLMTPIPSVNFKDVPLKQAIEDLKTLSGTGINVDIDTQAMQEAGVNLDQPVSLNLENIQLRSALNLLLKKANLTYVIENEALQITTHDRTRGDVKTVTYPVADLVIEPSNGTLPGVNSFQAALERQAGNTGVVNQGQTPWMASTSLNGGTPVGSSNAYSPYNSMHVPGGDPQKTVGGTRTIEETLIDLIQKIVAPDTWVDVGGKGTIRYYPNGLALVVSQTQDIQEQVADLLAALRRLQELEVAIEMKMITVSEAFYEMIGVNFDITLNNNQARYGVDLTTQNFQLPGQPNVFRPTNFVSGLTPTGTFTPDFNIPITNSSFQVASQPPFGGFPGTLGMDGGLSMGLAFLSEIQVFMFMEAAQVDRRANVMQAPKITVFNGQTANITVQDQQFFLTGVNLVQAGAQVFFVPNQQPFPLGVQLQVTPVVSADRRFVRVNLQPTLTNLASTNVPLIPVQIPVPQLFEGPGAASTTGGQPVIFQMFFQQPTFTQISLNTTVQVPDGGTVLLGGLKTLSEGRNEAGPPILSKIPYIDRLFRNTAYGRESQSLLIMVTPRIIINEEEEQIFLGNIPPIPREQGP